MLLNYQGLNIVEGTEEDLYKCPNCQGTGFFSFAPHGTYYEIVTSELMMCADCKTIIDRGNLVEGKFLLSNETRWLLASGDMDGAGCPVCGL